MQETIQVTVKCGPLQPGPPLCVDCERSLLSHVMQEVWPLASVQKPSPVLGSGWLPPLHTLVNVDRTHTCCCLHLHPSVPTSLFKLITCMQWTVQGYYYYIVFWMCSMCWIHLYLHISTLCPALCKRKIQNPHCSSSVLPFRQCACCCLICALLVCQPTLFRVSPSPPFF